MIGLKEIGKANEISYQNYLIFRYLVVPGSHDAEEVMRGGKKEDFRKSTAWGQCGKNPGQQSRMK